MTTGVRRKGLATLVLVLVTATSAAAGCASQPDRSSEATEAEGSARSHVHGFAPGRAGEVLIATHDGLMQVEGDAAPEPVGASRHDLMGLTSTGTGRHLASGHPDPRVKGMPADLGVVESRDGGVSWKPLSWYGTADFHVLEARGGRIYAYDGHAGVLRTSSNGRRWRERRPPDEIASLAIDPRDSDRLLVATPSGLAASSNAGKGWRSLPGAAAGRLSWPAGRRLYLVDPTGTILLSRDAGRTWHETGELGAAPATFEAIGPALYAALLDGTVRRSTDDGASWSVMAAL